MDEIRFPCVVPFDIDKDGNGPCPQEVKVKTIYQVWDDCLVTLAEFDTQEEADTWVRGFHAQRRQAEIVAFRESLSREMRADVEKLRKMFGHKKELTPPQKAANWRQLAWDLIVGMLKKTK